MRRGRSELNISRDKSHNVIQPVSRYLWFIVANVTFLSGCRRKTLSLSFLQKRNTTCAKKGKKITKETQRETQLAQRREKKEKHKENTKKNTTCTKNRINVDNFIKTRFSFQNDIKVPGSLCVFTLLFSEITMIDILAQSRQWHKFALEREMDVETRQSKQCKTLGLDFVPWALKVSTRHIRGSPWSLSLSLIVLGCQNMWYVRFWPYWWFYGGKINGDVDQQPTDRVNIGRWTGRVLQNEFCAK